MADLFGADEKPRVTPGCVIDIPDTVEHRANAFCHRNAYNTTHMQRMRKELDDLIALVRQERANG